MRNCDGGHCSLTVVTEDVRGMRLGAIELARAIVCSVFHAGSMASEEVPGSDTRVIYTTANRIALRTSMINIINPSSTTQPRNRRSILEELEESCLSSKQLSFLNTDKNQEYLVSSRQRFPRSISSAVPITPSLLWRPLDQSCPRPAL